jgi:hypothetical protein
MPEGRQDSQGRHCRHDEGRAETTGGNRAGLILEDDTGV